MKQFAALLLISVLIGCSGSKITEKMQSWLGHTESELVSSWGPPTSVYKMDDGSKILTYSYQRNGYQIEGQAWTDREGVTHYTAPAVAGAYAATRSFTINSDHIIISGQWHGR